MRFRFSLCAGYTVPSAFIPLSLLTFRVQVPAYSTKKQCRTIRHIAASVFITFARSIRLQSYPHPHTSTSSRFLFVHTLSASSIMFVRVFPVLFPRTQTGYERMFLFFSLSQFYGCRNPRAPVFVVCLCFLFARAETQRRINGLFSVRMCTVSESFSLSSFWFCSLMLLATF